MEKENVFNRFIKKRVRSMLGFKSFDMATSIPSGVEAMHMIKKEHIVLRSAIAEQGAVAFFVKAPLYLKKGK